MKVAVSIPDRTFSAAEALAKRLKTSRSALYARALDAFVRKYTDEEITASWNAAAHEVSEEELSFVREATRQTAARIEW